MRPKPHIRKRHGVWWVLEDGHAVARRYTFADACLFAFLRIGPR